MAAIECVCVCESPHTPLRRRLERRVGLGCLCQRGTDTLTHIPAKHSRPRSFMVPSRRLSRSTRLGTGVVVHRQSFSAEFSHPGAHRGAPVKRT